MKTQCPHCNSSFDIEEPGKYQCPNCNNIFSFEVKITVQKTDTETKKGISVCKNLETVEKKKGNAIKKFFRILSFLLGLCFFVFCLLVLYSNQDTETKFILCFFCVALGVFFIGLSFIKKEKQRKIYIICNNPHCDFEGYIELPSVTNFTLNSLLLRLADVNVYYYKESVFCPKCGCRLR